jgi:hypothetical protein
LQPPIGRCSVAVAAFLRRGVELSRNSYFSSAEPQAEEEGIQVLIWLRMGHNLCKRGEVVFHGAPRLVATPAAPYFCTWQHCLVISTHLIRNANKMLLLDALERVLSVKRLWNEF